MKITAQIMALKDRLMIPPFSSLGGNCDVICLQA
jgi:hypothetical protein